MSALSSACLLALDTSTERLCLALQTREGESWALETEGGPLASAQLLPRVLEGLEALQLGFDQLDAVAYARGPGAFTGLRTACSVAQGIALGSGKPVLGLDSLMLVADDAWVQAGRPAAFAVWVAMDARMDEVYAAQYRREGDHWSVLQAPALYAWEALAQRWAQQPPAGVAGSALTVFAERLPLAGLTAFPHETDRPGSLMRLAQAGWQRGETFDAALALPLYLRDKVALTTAEREARSTGRA